MGLREFRDSQGVVWKVWDVTPDWLDRRTLAEDYMREWQDGWLCFESSDARRRLAQYPSKWEELNDAELERLLGQAHLVRRRGPGEGFVDARAGAESASAGVVAPPTVPGFQVGPSRPPDVERPLASSPGDAAPGDAAAVTLSEGAPPDRSRTFKDPTGRTFTAALYRIALNPDQEAAGSASPGTVLRFVSGSLVLDLEEWPADWDRRSEGQLLELLARAQPPHDESAITDSLPVRRRTDLPA